MKNRYDGNPGMEARVANVRQNRMEAEHSAKDAFVKRVQEQQARHAGRAPNLMGEAMEFNAYMCNNGEHAQEVAREITSGMDKVAFPLK